MQQPADAGAAEQAAPFFRFSKAVPTTSTAPIFKFVLPADIVSGPLAHLLGAEFELVADSGGLRRSWAVTILPRRNKGKHEFMVQGWRAFAEAQEVQAGDLLHFTLATARQLHVRVARRALPAVAAAPLGPLPQDTGAAMQLEDIKLLPEQELSMLLDEEGLGNGDDSGASEPRPAVFGLDSCAAERTGVELPPPRCPSPQMSVLTARAHPNGAMPGPNTPPATHHQLLQEAELQQGAAPLHGPLFAGQAGGGHMGERSYGSCWDPAAAHGQQPTALDAAHVRASQAEARARVLERALASLRGEVLHASLCGLAQTHALHGVAARLPAAGGGPAAPLNGRLRSATANITDTLWHLHRLGQDRGAEC